MECGYVNVNWGSHRIRREARIPDRYPDQNTIHQSDEPELNHTLNNSHRAPENHDDTDEADDNRDNVEEGWRQSPVWTPANHLSVSHSSQPLTARSLLICKISQSVEEIIISLAIQIYLTASSPNRQFLIKAKYRNMID